MLINTFYILQEYLVGVIVMQWVALSVSITVVIIEE